MGPCITKDKSNKAFLRDLFIKIEEKNIKKPYITAVINIKPNEKLKIPENPSLILLEKKELRKTLDVPNKYPFFKNFKRKST